MQPVAHISDGLTKEQWASREADRLAAEAERKAQRQADYWQRIGPEYDAEDREAKLLKELSAEDQFGWKDQPNQVSDVQIQQSLIGREVARDAWVDGQTRARVLREQSDDLVRRLEGQGIPMRQGRAVTMVGLVSGIAERATDYRNSNMVPVMQSRNVHDMMKHVQYIVDTTKSGRLRMWVVSGGWVPLADYRREHQAHCRRISKLAADKELKRRGIEIVYYNVENTIQRGDDGTPMLNMHSHLLVRCRRYVGKKRWPEVMARVRAAMPKGYVHDSQVQSAKEAVKYVFKPAEFDQLTDAELAELFHQVHGRPAAETGKERDERPLKFFHPLGDMRCFRRSLKAQKRKLIRVPTQDDRWVWRVTEKRKPRDDKPTSAPPQDNLLLAVTSPMPRFSPRFEPVLVVVGYTGDLDEVIRVNRIEHIADRARSIDRERRAVDRQADAGAAGASIQDTTTTTVRGREPPDRRGGAPPGQELASSVH